MQRHARVVREHKNHIELLQAILNSLQRSELNFPECYHRERWLREMDQTIGRGLETGTGAMGDTLERELSERYVEFEVIARLVRR